jgi:hypothetical protein
MVPFLRRITAEVTFMRLICAVAITALAGFGAFACSNSTSPSNAPRTLNVMITDSPFSDAKALLVTFSDVNVHRADEDEGWKNLPFADGGSARTCDLKKLENSEDILGTGALQPGRYTQVRLVVSAATLYFDNPSTGDPCAPSIAAPQGRQEAVDIPSGEVKLNRQFEVKDTAATTMLLDFDGDKSVRETGNGRFVMTPVIEIVSVK